MEINRKHSVVFRLQERPRVRSAAGIKLLQRLELTGRITATLLSPVVSQRQVQRVQSRRPHVSRLFVIFSSESVVDVLLHEAPTGSTEQLQLVTSLFPDQVPSGDFLHPAERLPRAFKGLVISLFR